MKMNNSLDSFMAKLPVEMGREILSFLLPKKSDISFSNKIKKSASNKLYSKKYESALCKNKALKNKENLTLSRIWKKNGKHRYYIVKKEIAIIYIEEEYEYVPIYCYRYFSEYVGKDLTMALIVLLR